LKKSCGIYIFLTSRPPLKETVLGVFDFVEISAGGPKNYLIDGFCAEFVTKSIGNSHNYLSLGGIKKNWQGVAKILTSSGFCAAVFSLTASLKNNLILLRL
jgi:hypothetical protein